MLVVFQSLCMILIKQENLAWIMISIQDKVRNKRLESRCLRTNRPTEYQSLHTFFASEFKVSLSKDVF